MWADSKQRRKSRLGLLLALPPPFHDYIIVFQPPLKVRVMDRRFYQVASCLSWLANCLIWDISRILRQRAPLFFVSQSHQDMVDKGSLLMRESGFPYSEVKLTRGHVLLYYETIFFHISCLFLCQKSKRIPSRGAKNVMFWFAFLCFDTLALRLHLLGGSKVLKFLLNVDHGPYFG